MVKEEHKKSIIYYVPECTCNKKNKRVFWKTIRSNVDLEMLQGAEDNEELHKLSYDIVNFIADTGKMTKEDIIENFPEYKEDQLSIAANMSMYPIIFPKRRRASPSEFENLKKHAIELTSQYRKSKYYVEPKEEECDCDTYDDYTCEYHSKV